MVDHQPVRLRKRLGAVVRGQTGFATGLWGSGGFRRRYQTAGANQIPLAIAFGRPRLDRRRRLVGQFGPRRHWRPCLPIPRRLRVHGVARFSQSAIRFENRTGAGVRGVLGWGSGNFATRRQFAAPNIGPRRDGSPAFEIRSLTAAID